MLDPSDVIFSTPLTPDVFAETFHYPAGMVHLALDCGMESAGGKITAVDFCNWFVAHYNIFRAKAGLPLLDPPTKAMPPDLRAATTISNVLRTLADYFASRTSSLEYKEEWMNLSNRAANYANRIR